eukprot:jgi/Chlat1/1205/Chrsp115S00742
MASSDEDDAEMRKLRALRAGASGREDRVSLSTLRERQMREQARAQAASSYFKNVPKPPEVEDGSNETGNGVDEDDDEDGPAGPQAVIEEPDDEMAMRMHLPMSFGKKQEAPVIASAVHDKTKRVDISATTQQSKDSNGVPMIGPPPPPPAAESESDDGDDSDGDADDGPDIDPYRIPLANEIRLGGHTKTVAAVAIDHSGSRVLTGSHDYMVRMFDFQGMNQNLRSFRQLEPFEAHPITALSFSPSGDLFMATSGAAKFKIFDRDGLMVGETVRGDMYLRDAKHTKGHLTAVTGGQWHPTERNTVLTCSEDGTLRVWDTSDLKQQKHVIKPKLARPMRVSVTTCSYNADGKLIAGGLADGSLQVWKSGSFMGQRPDFYVAKAHAPNEDISCVRFYSDSQTLVSRSCDDTLKIWDLRKFKDPLASFDDLPNIVAQTGVAFSPDGQLIVTGTSVTKGGETGALVFFDRAKLELVRRVGVSQGSVVALNWHPRLNQILAGCGDKKSGATHVLYDPEVSERGALVCVARAPRKTSALDMVYAAAAPVVRNPHALPLFRDEPNRKRQREKDRADPTKSHKPDMPISGPGFGGRLGNSQKSVLTQYLMKEAGMKMKSFHDEDPRAAMLKHADEAAKNPMYTAAYKETQPKPVFDEESEEED